MIGSWLTVASTPLNAAAWLAGTPLAVRWTSASKPVPWAAPATASSTVAGHGHAADQVRAAREPHTRTKTANAAAGSRGCQAAGRRVQAERPRHHEREDGRREQTRSGQAEPCTAPGGSRRQAPRRERQHGQPGGHVDHEDRPPSGAEEVGADQDPAE